MIVLYTDFGLAGPYMGQMQAVLLQAAPKVPVINLMADAPVHNPLANSYLLWNLACDFPKGTVFLAVVDPGVGSTERKPVVAKSDGYWFVGPDNGLFDVLAKRNDDFQLWEIRWHPDQLSSSFHGRDLFAPVAARLALGDKPDMEKLELNIQRISSLPDELAEIIYIDHFGNLMTGIRAASVHETVNLDYQGCKVPRVTTFSDVSVGEPLCYENSSGLLEIAVNQGRAEQYFTAEIGDSVSIPDS